MTCKNCGAEIPAGTRFCNECGAPVNRQPSREEIRARVQGGGRHAAAPSAPRRGEDQAGPLPEKLGPQHIPLLCLVAGLLGILQIVYLLVRTVFVTLGTGQSNLSVVSYSIYGALRQSEATFLGVLLLLLALALLASFAVPMILWGRPRALVTAGLSVLLLILFLIAVATVKSSFAENFMGVKPKLGFWGYMFLLNCLLIPGLVFLGGQLADLEPEPEPAAERAPARAPAARARASAGGRGPVSRPVSPMQKAPRRPGVNGPVRPASPARNVTPPDAKTIAALRRMAQMHKEGLVSDEEFARIKAECVARGWIREG